MTEFYMPLLLLLKYISHQEGSKAIMSDGAFPLIDVAKLL